MPQTHARSDLDDVEIRRALALHAGEGSVAYRSSKVILTLLQRCRAICGFHRVLAQLSIVYMLDFHPDMLISSGPLESRYPKAVRL